MKFLVKKNSRILLIVSVILIVLLASCAVNEVEPVNTVLAADTREDYNNVFEQIGYDDNYYIVYHKRTKVMYVVSDGKFNSGSFTLLVNPDGTPMIYEAEVNE